VINFTSVYILILVFALVTVVILIFSIRKNDRQQRFTPLAGIAFAFIIASIVFSDSGRILGYTLMGIGIVVAIVDIFLKLHGKD
jgi:hypothetical protein